MAGIILWLPGVPLIEMKFSIWSTCSKHPNFTARGFVENLSSSVQEMA